MNLYRIALFTALGAALAAILFAAAYAGLSLCAPDPPPGDELWTWRHRLVEAWTVVNGEAAFCLVDDRAAAAMTAIARQARSVLGAAILAVLLWETAGRALRRAWWRAYGDHAILLGGARDLAGLAKDERRRGPVCFLAATPEDRKGLSRRFPLAEIARADDKAGAAKALAALGAGKARFLAAASRSDLLNAETMGAALDAGTLAAKRLMVRLEAPDVRVLFADGLRRRAAKRGAGLAVVSTSRMQVRAGNAAAIEGLRASGAKRFALCGAGELMQSIAFHLARQGYGLEDAVPELTILRTGMSDFTAGALDRLMAADMAIRVRATIVDGANTLALERALTAVALGEPPLAAVHCADPRPGQALAMAERFAQVIARLGKPVPPVVAYDAAGNAAAAVRCVVAPDLAEAQAATRLRDTRAIAVHNAYVAEQKALKGDAFGELPGEREWEALPEYLQDDNRATADHIAYKLARIGFAVRDGAGASDVFTAAEIETLARIEHARWMAAKAVEGWRYAAKRDNGAMLHPSMLPFEALSEADRRKDRTVAAQLPALLAAAGQHARRETQSPETAS